MLDHVVMVTSVYSMVLVYSMLQVLVDSPDVHSCHINSKCSIMPCGFYMFCSTETAAVQIHAVSAKKTSR